MGNITKNGKGGNAIASGDYSYAEGGDAGDSKRGPGGDGGNAIAKGLNSYAVGGKGGRGGVSQGGNGGHVEVGSDNAGGIGGNGAESCQHDGCGGRGGTAALDGFFPFDVEYHRRARMKLPYGAPNIFIGRGGDSPDTPQYKARRLIVEGLKQKYFYDNRVPHSGYDIWYDRQIVPLEWLNAELLRQGHRWTVTVEDEEYVFADLRDANYVAQS